VSEDKPRMVPVYTVSKAITENGAQQNTSVR
jgi:hypothetical protein